jgi:hypothetical protein
MHTDHGQDPVVVVVVMIEPAVMLTTRRLLEDSADEQTIATVPPLYGVSDVPVAA